MKIFQITFGVLLIWCAIILTLWLTPMPEAATGQLHPQFKTMLHSGTPLSAQTNTKMLSLGFGLCVFSIFGACLLIGLRRYDKEGMGSNLVKIGMVIFTLIFLAMVFSWWEYSKGGEIDYFMGWPSPTAWMIFGIWFFPLVFAAFCMVKFDEWFLDPKDLEKFRALLKEQAEAKKTVVSK